MRKTVFVVAMLALFVASAFAAGVPDTVMLDKAKAKQPGVSFNHKAHVAAVSSCDTCHHTNKGVTAAKAAEVKACSSCHMQAQGKIGTIADMSMAKNPFHIDCVKCHKTEKKGPTVCKDCHKK